MHLTEQEIPEVGIMVTTNYCTQRKAGLHVSPPVIKVKEHTPSADFAPSDTGNFTARAKSRAHEIGYWEVLKMEEPPTTRLQQ